MRSTQRGEAPDPAPKVLPAPEDCRRSCVAPRRSAPV